MAHLVDGVLSAEVVVGGAVLAVAGLARGLRGLDPERVPHAGVLSAAFFVASLVHVPIGPTSVHLILNGLLGMVLGWAAVPAIFVALVLQAVFFGYGGITVLGVNTVVMAAPALVCSFAFAPRIGKGSPFVWGAAAGASAVAMTCALVGLALALSGREFVLAAKLIFVAHLPVMIVEGAITGAAAALLHKVKPEVLTAAPPLSLRAPDG
jgi:cobalt/nickel transport system permease protein